MLLVLVFARFFEGTVCLCVCMFACLFSVFACLFVNVSESTLFRWFKWKLQGKPKSMCLAPLFFGCCPLVSRPAKGEANRMSEPDVCKGGEYVHVV